MTQHFSLSSRQVSYKCPVIVFTRQRMDCERVSSLPFSFNISSSDLFTLIPFQCSRVTGSERPPSTNVESESETFFPSSSIVYVSSKTFISIACFMLNSNFIELLTRSRVKFNISSHCACGAFVATRLFVICSLRVSGWQNADAQWKSRTRYSYINKWTSASERESERRTVYLKDALSRGPFDWPDSARWGRSFIFDMEDTL